MKKFFWLASATVLMLGSCSDDFSSDNLGSSQKEYKSKVVAKWIGTPDTRTSVSWDPSANDGKGAFVYTWQDGDAIGLFNAQTEATGYTNAPFYWVNNDVFGGDLDMLTGDNFYGYYPYAAGATLTDGEIIVPITGQQNFNHKAAALPAPATGQPNGSFAQFAAPSVSYGTVTEDNNISLNFYGVAAYLVVPVTGYAQGDDAIKQVTLSVQATTESNNSNSTLPNDDQGNYQLYGDLKVNVGSFFDEDGVKSEDASGSVELQKEDDQTVITLNCGKGVTIGMNETVNFWFVVPADLPLNGSTFTITIDGKEYTREVSGTNAPEIMGMNTTRRIMSSENTAFVYNPSNTTFITSPLQFLEYAYLLTNGYEALNLWYNGLQTVTGANMSYSNLMDMVTLNAGTTIDGKLADNNGFTINSVVVVGDLNLTQSYISSLIGKNGSNLYEVELPEYYETIYEGYVENGLPTIGGNQPNSVDIEGEFGDQESATISGLVVKGNGMFAVNPANISNHVNNLVFSNCTVDATGIDADSYFWLASPSGQNFDNVEIQEGCVFKYPTTAPGAVFDTYMTQYAAAYNVTEWPTGWKFANNLLINSATFDMTEFEFGVSDFNNIEVQTEGAVITVADEESATEFIEAVNKYNNYYSVIDDETSYWTGTVATSATPYAEGLAYAVINRKNYTFADYSLDLMNLPWVVATAQSTITIAGAEGGSTISNVLINSDSKVYPSTSSSQPYSLFGFQANISDITVNGLTIDVDNEEANANLSLVAGLAAKPGTSVSNVIVKNLSIAAGVSKDQALGGLFWKIDNNGFLTGENSVSFATGFELNKDFYYGSVAGEYAYNVIGDDSNQNKPIEVTLPETVQTGQPAIGLLSLTITPVEGANPWIYLSSEVDDITLTTNGTVNSGYTVWIKNGETGTFVPYVWNGTKFVIQNI